MRRGLFSVKSLPIELTLSILESRGEKELVTQAVWWARLGRTNDQPIMSPERSRPTRSSDVDPNTKRRRPRPTSPPSSGRIHPIGSQLCLRSVDVLSQAFEPTSRVDIS